MMETRAGKFIVIEGPDGAGKSTLAKGLTERLRARGEDVLAVREPGGTPVAERARELAFDPDNPASEVAELFLVLAARADHVAKVIAPALTAGRTVLSDRFELSTRAYQVAGRGLPERDVLAANHLATGGVTPDLTVVLDVSPDLGRHRQRASGKTLDRMEREGAELHERVSSVFREATGIGIVHVDATGAAATVEEAAWAVVCEAYGWSELTPGRGRQGEST